MKITTSFLSAFFAHQALAASIVPRNNNCDQYKLPFDSIDGTPVKLRKASHYSPGTLLNLTSVLGGILTTNGIPSFCRLQLTITTNAATNNSADSELWLPDSWNSRLLGTGNGGFAGDFSYSAMGYDGLGKGFATFGTNTGHYSSSGDGKWALNNPEAIIDFGYRALHLTTVVAKNLTAHFYGTAAKKNYYIGCSTGGRQALKTATRFPDDFDGLVAGAPANRMALLLPWELHSGLQVTPVNSSHWLDVAHWTLIHEEVLNQCDLLDGVKDGVVSYSRQCNFRPETLTCTPGEDTSKCLTVPQITALKTLYRDYVETNDTFIFSRFEPGGELVYPETGGIVAATPFAIANSFYQYIVLNDTNWDFHNLDFSIISQGVAQNPGNMDTVDPELTAFHKKGGKVLQFHGLGDPLIASGNSFRWIDSVEAFSRSALGVESQSFYRFFPVPGMAHCSGGLGPNGFGGPGQRASGMPPGNEKDASYDILASLVEWVEKDIAPDYLIGTSYVNNNATLGTQYTRKLCVYPAQPVYMGGDQNSETSFVCK
ncbi:feruloyl esterase-like protein [Meredithblackwellia eburnea MCA 4105]